MDHKELINVARYLFAGNKGILAADESTKSSTRRFEALNITASPEMRRKYRQMLFTAPDLANYISGVILYDETIRQADDRDTNFSDLLQQKGILPGIKVDKGLVELTNFAPEQVTEGLDGLQSRLAEYAKLGARFAKWRAVFEISATTPTDSAIHVNATMFGRYAALCQQAGLVPIVEPEVLYDGRHTLAQSAATIERVMNILFQILGAYRVDLQAMILKTSMALPGKDSAVPNDPAAVARATVAALQASVPDNVAGIVFLSGGQNPEQATANLQAFSQLGELPWPLTFSYSRAVQDPAMKLWLGRDENIRAAQDAFIHRLRMNCAARTGRYSQAMENEA